MRIGIFMRILDVFLWEILACYENLGLIEGNRMAINGNKSEQCGVDVADQIFHVSYYLN